MRVNVLYNKFGEESMFDSRLVARVNGWLFEVIYYTKNHPEQGDDYVDFSGYHWTAEREGWQALPGVPRPENYSDYKEWADAWMDFRNGIHFASDFYSQPKEVAVVAAKLIEIFKAMPEYKEPAMKTAEVEI